MEIMRPAFAERTLARTAVEAHTSAEGDEEQGRSSESGI